MPSSLTVVIASSTVLLLIGAYTSLLRDIFPKTGAVVSVMMVASGVATSVLGSSQAGVGLSRALGIVLFADMVMLVTSAFFTFFYLSEEWSSPSAGAVLAVMMLAASVGIFALTDRENGRVREAARVAVVTSYLDALKTGDFEAAYRSLCAANRDTESFQAFAKRQMELPRLIDYAILGQPRQESRGMQFTPIILPPPPDPIEVDLRFTDGTSRKEAYALPDPSTVSRACVGDESQVPTEDGAPE